MGTAKEEWGNEADEKRSAWFLDRAQAQASGGKGRRGREARRAHVLTSLSVLVLLDDGRLLVDLGGELLLGHGLSLGVLGLHSRLGHGSSDGRVDGRRGLGLVVSVESSDSLVVGHCMRKEDERERKRSASEMVIVRSRACDELV